MAESDPKLVNNLEIGADYKLKQNLFNTTVLHPHEMGSKKAKWIYWEAVAVAHLEVGDELTYKGTAAESDLVSSQNSADVLRESLIFEPGARVLERYSNIKKGDLLGVIPDFITIFSKKQ